MIADLKPYPAYKDSGVEWLGQVPEGWDLQPLKRFVRFSGGGTPSKSQDAYWDGSIPWVSPKDMVGSRIADSQDHVSNQAIQESATSLVPPGAVLLVARSGILRRKIPVAINDVEVTLNQDMKALRPRGHLLATYLLRFIQGNEPALLFEWTKHGATVESVEHGLMANCPFPLPPPQDQVAITRFLDHVDARIQRLITAKERLIELLEEEKQAITDQAVTGGLGSGVPRKPSGVDWIGDIPEHWERTRLKHVVRHIIDCEHKTAPQVDDSPYRVVRTSCVKNGRFVRAGSYCTDQESFKLWTRRGPVTAGDVLLTREAPAGEACIVPQGEHLCLGQRIVLLKPDSRRCLPSFLVSAIYAGAPRREIEVASQGSTVPHFNVDEIGWLPLVIPPVNEQRWLTARIDEENRRIDAAASQAHDEITLLRELRTRLISDVVTGKLDVREAASRLPDDTDAEVPELDEVLEGAVA